MAQESLDLLIIGAGPAGLSAADAAAREGLDYLVIEKGTIADTIRQYPVGRTLFSTPNELEMREGALHPVREKPTREELLSHYIHFVLDADLRINTGEEVIEHEMDVMRQELFARWFLAKSSCRITSISCSMPTCESTRAKKSPASPTRNPTDSSF